MTEKMTWVALESNPEVIFRDKKKYSYSNDDDAICNCIFTSKINLINTRTQTQRLHCANCFFSVGAQQIHS